MKQFFQGRKHISILAYLLFSFFILFSSPKTVLASCTSVSSNTCTGAQTSWCSIVKPPAGNISRFCCDTVQDCADEKTKIIQDIKDRTAGGEKRPIVDPTEGCTGSSDTNPQINTGLGCISTSTAGFTSALLTFLAGTAGAIALLIMLIATVQIMTGGDNAEQVKKGKELFTGAITGLLFIIFSVTLLRIIAGDIIKLPGFN